MPDFLSGKIDVFQTVLPRVTSTGREPQPRAFFPNVFLISSDCFFVIVRKCQPAIPGYSQTLERILYSVFGFTLCRFKACLVVFHPLSHVPGFAWVIHYLRVRRHVMRLKILHPLFECFTFGRRFAQITFQCFHSFLLFITHCISAEVKLLAARLYPQGTTRTWYKVETHVST